MRIAVSFPVYFKTIDKDKVHRVKDNYIQHKTSDREKIFSSSIDQLSLDLTSRKFDKMEPHLMCLFENIIKKLDLLVSMHKAIKKEEENYIEGLCKNISSNGFMVIMDQNLEKDDIVELKIDFPMFPPLVIIALASVKNTCSEDNEFKASLKLIAINSDDREELIGYIFKRQRELLRRKKNDVF